MLPQKAVLLANGVPPPRISPSIRYSFRPSSHMLFLAGRLPPGAFLLLRDGETHVFLPPPSDDDAIWHGDSVDEEVLLAERGFTTIHSRAELESELESIPREALLTLPSLHSAANEELAALIGRKPDVAQRDRELAEAIIGLRLIHDEFGLAEIRRATATTIAAQRAAKSLASAGVHEREVVAVIEAEFIRAGMTSAFPTIASVHGEVLHNFEYTNILENGQILLVDCGAETEQGYASDLSRSYVVGGSFSPEQNEIYQLVLEAQREAIAAIRPGVRYREVHTTASRVIAAGLLEMGILRGEVDTLVAEGVHALFFPHGIGHILGLDVHDMEDLGDLVGYPQGRTRSQQFGLSFLRFDRVLEASMVLTVEPGFYCIPALTGDVDRLKNFAEYIVEDKLRHFAPVRGIRVEDVVLVTETGSEVLSDDLSK